MKRVLFCMLGLAVAVVAGCATKDSTSAEAGVKTGSLAVQDSGGSTLGELGSSSSSSGGADDSSSGSTGDDATTGTPAEAGAGATTGNDGAGGEDGWGSDDGSGDAMASGPGDDGSTGVPNDDAGTGTGDSSATQADAANMCASKLCIDPVFDCPLQGCFNGCTNLHCN